MALKIPVVDRTPTYPGRVKLTPVSGQANTYDLVRADQPIEEGTPINKALFDQKAYALTEDVIIYVSTSGSDVTGTGTSAAPYATIQKAIDSLPKWLDGYAANISIAAGTYDELIRVNGFQGGILTIGNSGRAIIVRGITVSASSLVRLYMNITRSSALGGTPLTVRNGSNVQIGDSLVIDSAGGGNGMVVENGSSLFVGEDVLDSLKITFNNCPYNAIYATGGSRIQLSNVQGSNNGTGFRANAGVITYISSTMSATTLHATTNGGRIYAGAQTSVTKY